LPQKPFVELPFLELFESAPWLQCDLDLSVLITCIVIDHRSLPKVFSLQKHRFM